MERGGVKVLLLPLHVAVVQRTFLDFAWDEERNQRSPGEGQR